MKKIDNYLRAFQQLTKAAAAWAAQPDDDLYRDGLIQRFEFTVELAWKSLKEFLEDQGAVVAHATPKAVLRDAYAAGYLDDPAPWLAILDARNLTSHVYSEETARTIAQDICTKFLPVFRSLADFYRDQQGCPDTIN